MNVPVERDFCDNDWEEWWWWPRSRSRLSRKPPFRTANSQESVLWDIYNFNLVTVLARLHLLGLLLLLVNVSHSPHHLLHLWLLYLHLHPVQQVLVQGWSFSPKFAVPRESSARVSDSSRRYRGSRVFIVQQTRESFREATLHCKDETCSTSG